MTLPQGQYADPAIWYKKQQEREEKQKQRSGRQSCKGCSSQAKVWGVEYCIKDLAPPGIENMVRCKYFKEAKNV